MLPGWPKSQYVTRCCPSLNSGSLNAQPGDVSGGVLALTSLHHRGQAIPFYRPRIGASGDCGAVRLHYCFTDAGSAEAEP
jgi:hypothetical protein